MSLRCHIPTSLAKGHGTYHRVFGYDTVDIRNMGLYLGLHFEPDCQSKGPATLHEQEYCRLANSYMVGQWC